MKPRSAKSKGTKLEKWVARELQSVGLRAHRQPGSGIYSDWPHDACFELNSNTYVVECKARKEGHRTLDRWLGKADILVIKRDFYPPNVYMSWDVFKELVNP